VREREREREKREKREKREGDFNPILTYSQKRTRGLGAATKTDTFRSRALAPPLSTVPQTQGQTAGGLYG
jgi:hypothetical protein